MARWLLFSAAFFFTGCFNSLLLTPTNSSGPLGETVIADAKKWTCRNKIAVIDIDGMILNARSSGLLGSGENPMAIFRERLDAAADDPHVKAVVLRINSPGGAVTASDVMYQEVVHFRRDTHKPVVACMMDVAASGAYYIAMGCDRVYAHPSTVTGSIGVIMSLYNAKDLFAKLGVNSNPIKSGPNKDIGNPGREMTKEERAILQGMVDSFYGQFVHVVAEGRQMPEDQVRKLADGRVYTGVDAQKLGLVDEIGYLEDALRDAMAQAKVKDATIIAYDRGDGYRGSIYSTAPRIPSQINVKLDLPGLSASEGGAAFMYLWQPGVVP
jgi:protease-4